MTTPRKTAKEIADAIISQMESALSTTVPLYQKAFLRILAKVLGGLWALLYQFAGFAILQLFVRTASNKPVIINGQEITPLKEHAAAVGLYQGTGQAAEHTVTVTVLAQGGTLQSGTKIVNTATEILYQVVGGVLLDAATVVATIRALDVGEAANVEADQVLSFVSAIAACEKDVVVIARTVEGVDVETTEAFRQRVMDRYAAHPQGGAYADYRDWGQSVTGVLRVYPYSGGTIAGSGAGEIDVYVESSTDVDGIPTQALLDDVADAINLDEDGIATRRPINDYVNVLAITRLEFDITVGALAVPDEPAAQAAIEDALTAYFLAREPWITGLSVLPRTDIVTVAEIGGVVGRVLASLGGYTTGVTLFYEGASIDIYTLQEGEKAKLGAISWS